MQLELSPSPFGMSAQGSGVMVGVESAGWSVTSKSTVPWGGLFVPLSVSVTVTVQVAGALAGVEVGQSTVVEVLRAVTVIVSVPVLEAWIESGAGWYVAVMV
jgi:hypothetical protein